MIEPKVYTFTNPATGKTHEGTAAEIAKQIGIKPDAMRARLRYQEKTKKTITKRPFPKKKVIVEPKTPETPDPIEIKPIPFEEDVLSYPRNFRDPEPEIAPVEEPDMNLSSGPCAKCGKETDSKKDGQWRCYQCTPIYYKPYRKGGKPRP